MSKSERDLARIIGAMVDDAVRNVATAPQNETQKAAGVAQHAGAILDRRLVFPDDGLFKAKTVVAIIDVGLSTWFDWVKSGFAPKPIKIGCNTFWRGQDIWAFVEKVCETERAA